MVESYLVGRKREMFKFSFYGNFPMKNKIKISVTIDEDVLSWIDETIESGPDFSSRSHLINKAVSELRKKIQRK